MIISIDYDRTYTSAPSFWRAVIAFAALEGHQVICVTGRKPEHSLDDENEGIEVPVIYADGKLKREAAEAAGYEVDIWIDDEPGTIEKCRILEW